MSNPEKPIKAVIFDMGGVLLRTHDLEPRTKLASRFGLSRLELEALVFQSPSSIEAEKGLISEEDHWLYVADKLGLNPRNYRILLTSTGLVTGWKKTWSITCATCGLP